MFVEVHIEFRDGSDTIAWMEEWDNIQDFLVFVADQCDVPTEDVVGWSFTGNTDGESTEEEE